MKTEEVEIYSDQTNAAIMRHPGRKFPGVLIQGDTLYTLCQAADSLCLELDKHTDAFEEANDLRNRLRSYLTHYKTTLKNNDIELPFFENE